MRAIPICVCRQGKDKLAEYTIGNIQMERLETDEPYSGLVTHIQMKHLYTTQVYYCAVHPIKIIFGTLTHDTICVTTRRKLNLQLSHFVWLVSVIVVRSIDP